MKLALLLLAAAPPKGDIFERTMHALPIRGVVIATVLILITLSVLSWVIIAYKSVALAAAARETSKFLESFWQAKRLDAVYQTADALKRSPVAHVFRAGYVELGKLQSARQKDAAIAVNAPAAAADRAMSDLGDLENIQRALNRAAGTEITAMETFVPFLATAGSAAPFIGLFGTVLGIMKSFRDIGGMGSASLVVVGPGIAEALITTAIGLVAAVPAVMAYNYFVRRIRVLSSEMESFSSDFLNIVKRHFLG
ncbi:MAG TPA: MotA/TolQ/ExbB proton channel family protein [Polyangia bacterium]|jgi:biopolymer transport protein TolQ